jgi:hypothetical protein
MTDQKGRQPPRSGPARRPSDVTKVEQSPGYISPDITAQAGALAPTRLGRQCGDCSLCCKVYPNDDEQLVKPAGKWCTHCKPGKGGCGIYPTRPETCRRFTCRWLEGEFGDEWYPLKSKIVVRMIIIRPGTRVLDFNVDPAFPNRWREAPYYRKIKRQVIYGLTRPFEEGGFYTRVVVGPRLFYLYPTREIERPVGEITEEERDRLNAESNTNPLRA